VRLDIYIGSPVWAFNYTPAIGAFLDNIKLVSKKNSFMLLFRRDEGQHFKKLAEKLEGNTILSQIHFVEPLRSREKSIVKLEEWSNVLPVNS
jgi:hypothetical protein